MGFSLSGIDWGPVGEGIAAGIESSYKNSARYREEKFRKDAEAKIAFLQSPLAKDLANAQNTSLQYGRSLEFQSNKDQFNTYALGHRYFKEDPLLLEQMSKHIQNFTTPQQLDDFKTLVTHKQFSGFVHAPTDLEKNSAIKYGTMYNVFGEFYAHDPFGKASNTKRATMEYSIEAHKKENNEGFFNTAFDASTSNLTKEEYRNSDDFKRDVRADVLRKMSSSDRELITVAHTNYNSALDTVIRKHNDDLMQTYSSVENKIKRLRMSNSKIDQAEAEELIESLEEMKRAGKVFTSSEYRRMVKEFMAGRTIERGIFEEKDIAAYISSFLDIKQNQDKFKAFIGNRVGTPKEEKGSFNMPDANKLDLEKIKTHLNTSNN